MFCPECGTVTGPGPLDIHCAARGGRVAEQATWLQRLRRSVARIRAWVYRSDRDRDLRSGTGRG